MARISKTEGFILRRTQLFNKDFVVALFTHDFGKIIVLAKGVKTITSRRISHIQTGNLVSAVIYSKNNILYLRETSLISAFSTIKKDELKYNTVYLVGFILDRLLPANQKEQNLYLKTKSFIVNLAKSRIIDRKKIEQFINEILRELGFIDKKLSLYKLLSFIEELTNEKIPHHII